jgi:hypothetical protein
MMIDLFAVSDVRIISQKKDARQEPVLALDEAQVVP